VEATFVFETLVPADKCAYNASYTKRS
jgi:hypothetical protein